MLAYSRHTRSGITLVEVLIAIFVTGVGLLALLKLFPLGALEMAQAVKDDRTRIIAADAITIEQIGSELIFETERFVEASLAKGSVDRAKAKKLREAYEVLAWRAAETERKLQEARPQFKDPRVRYKADELLQQIGAIGMGVEMMAELMEMVEQF